MLMLLRHSLLRASFAALLLAGCFLTGCGSAGPAETTETFLQRVGAGDIDDAVEMVSSDVVNMVGSEKVRAGLRQQAQRVQDQEGIERIEVLSEEVTGDMATVRTRVTYGNGRTVEEGGELVKEDGDWKMTMSK